MQVITDEYMRRSMLAAKNYCIVILKAGPKRNQEGVESIIWEHGRRNFALRAEGILPIVCPVTDDSEIAGIGILNTNVEEAKKVMDEDPGVQAGVFVYELHPCRSFPGDCLPS